MVSNDVVSNDVHSLTMWGRWNAYGIQCGPPWQDGHWWDGALGATSKKSTKCRLSVHFRRVANPIATLLVLIKVGEPYRLVRTAVLKRFDASRTNSSHSVQSP